MTRKEMHQNAEERLELLHTLTEIVYVEVDKRMDALTAQKRQEAQEAPTGKCPVGRKLRAFCTRTLIKNNQKNNSINTSRGYTAGAEARETRKN